MSYIDFRLLLLDMFSRLNTRNTIQSPQDLYTEYATRIRPLATNPELEDDFTQLRNDTYLPKAAELVRLLLHLRQRFSSNVLGNPLVGRLRAEVVTKERPIRNLSKDDLTERERPIAQLSPPKKISSFSRFQVDGWRKVIEVIDRNAGLVITAPTGSGKTEVFLMPIIYNVAQYLRAKAGKDAPCFVLLYPRVELLKDQLARVFSYAHFAEKEYLSQPDLFGGTKILEHIVIGFQFQGVKSDAPETRANREIFEEDGTFRIVRHCPICTTGILRAEKYSQGITPIRCDRSDCGVVFHTSISKNDHARTRPHLLITTAESLDRLYLNCIPAFEAYLKTIRGIVFDEAHLYYSLYGAHIYNLLRRIEDLVGNRKLAKIAVSATISNPERFAAKLFYGDADKPVEVHQAGTYPQEPAGLEVIYFVQSPEEEKRPGAAPTLIQSVMAMGHGVLTQKDRVLVFTESRDIAGRLEAQIRDAEGRKRLWDFRSVVSHISFNRQNCPETNPLQCSIYHEGECWRGILGGKTCFSSIADFQEQPLRVVGVSSESHADFSNAHVVVTTPALEVGVDDEHIKATIHYLPPQTIFSFIQRRGRAGRKPGEIAYTLMVLGITPSDHFYFFRRHRLVSGSYELPLNPQNPVIREMHNRLQKERAQMRSFIQQGGIEVGIWRWVWEQLENCHVLQRYYGQQFANQFDVTQQRRFLDLWIARESQNFEHYLNLRWTLQEIENEAPDQLHEVVHDALSGVDAFLSDQSMKSEDVGARLRTLYTELGRIGFDETDAETVARLEALENKVKAVWLALTRQQTWGVNLSDAERLYDFFRTLQKLYEHESVLRSAPDTLKIVLQALFYLHLGLEWSVEPGDCSSRVDYLIPDAYFQAVKPIVVEVRSSAEENSLSRLRQEGASSLGTLFLPYKPIYRYHGRNLSILDTVHNLDDIQIDGSTVTVNVDLHAEGTRQDSMLNVQKIYIKPLRSDTQGQQIVKMCPRCYNIYDVYHQRSCHGRLQPVKLYAEPAVERKYVYKEAALRRITRTLSQLEEIQGITTVFGSDVLAKTVNSTGTEYIITNNLFKQFQVRYKTSVRYHLSTKGLSWNLASIIDEVLADAALRQQVKATFRDTRKTFDDELVLHTAAHLLLKAIAAISGVNDQMLEYGYNIAQRELAVWERYEGGAGISEIFSEALRTRPLDVYRELLASVLCPVNLAEGQDWTDTATLHTRLTDLWKLPPDDEFIAAVARDAESERIVQMHQGQEVLSTCRRNDGCPACIYTTYCTDRHKQVSSVSRLVGEAILTRFVRRVERSMHIAIMKEAIADDTAVPPTLYADPLKGVYDVLLL